MLKTESGCSQRELRDAFNLYEFDVALIHDQWNSGAVPLNAIYQCVHNVIDNDMPCQSLALIHKTVFGLYRRPPAAQASILSLNGHFKYDGDTTNRESRPRSRSKPFFK